MGLEFIIKHFRKMIIQENLEESRVNDYLFGFQLIPAIKHINGGLGDYCLKWTNWKLYSLRDKSRGSNKIDLK